MLLVDDKIDTVNNARRELVTLTGWKNKARTQKHTKVMPQEYVRNTIVGAPSRHERA